MMENLPELKKIIDEMRDASALIFNATKAADRLHRLFQHAAEDQVDGSF
jgi:hypothetical protein